MAYRVIDEGKLGNGHFGRIGIVHLLIISFEDTSAEENDSDYRPGSLEYKYC
jgi:hypothetical protein